MAELRVSRGQLTDQLQTVYGQGVTDLIPLPDRQVYLIRFIDLHVSLPSNDPYVFVSDPAKDLNQQDYERRLAFNSTNGNAIEVTIGGWVSPLTYPLKNVLGGYRFDLKRLISDQGDDLALMQDEALKLKLLNPLGAGDTVGYNITGFVRLDADDRP